MGISLSLLLLAREEILEHKVFGSFDNGGDSQETKLEPSIKPNRTVILKKPTIKLIEPIVFSSPRPVTELDSTATKLQKVYKGYIGQEGTLQIVQLWLKSSGGRP